jgi:hypothetical protein
MAKKKPKSQQPAAAVKTPAPAESALASPYLATAHPPAKNPTLLAVSAILFVAWFLFLLLAALTGRVWR